MRLSRHQAGHDNFMRTVSRHFKITHERGRVGKLAADILARGGTLNDPALLEELRALEPLELALRKRIAAVLAQFAPPAP